jgi:hypothetical protein
VASGAGQKKGDNSQRLGEARNGATIFRGICRGDLYEKYYGEYLDGG